MATIIESISNVSVCSNNEDIGCDMKTVKDRLNEVDPDTSCNFFSPVLSNYYDLENLPSEFKLNFNNNLSITKIE